MEESSENDTKIMRIVHHVIAFCLAATLAGQARAQFPGDQHRSYFPPERPPPTSRETERELMNAFRRLKKGASGDRERVRAELMEKSDRLLGAMLKELRGGNHFEQRQVCLVLMQVADPRAVSALERLAGGGRRGARGLAALALGKVGLASSADPIRTLIGSSQPRSEMMAYLALGRLSASDAAKTLLRRLKQGRPTREEEALALALGLTGSADSLQALLRLVADRKDGLRRSAVTALGYLDQDLVAEVLIERADRRREEDGLVRIAALRGIAGMRSDPKLYREFRKRRKAEISDADEEAAWVLALAALGGEAALPEMVSWGTRSHREEVREAVAAGTILIGGKRAAGLARKLLGDEKDRVVRAALLAGFAHAGEDADPPVSALFVKNTDEQIRRAAVCGDVYLRGKAAAPTLRGLLDPAYKDDVRLLAAQLLEELGRDPLAARMICRARLQLLLDVNGLAGSWNLNALANAHIYRILDLDHARDRRGAGRAPGASGRPPDRSVGAVVTAPTPEEEDLRWHLDRHPYVDRRDRIEMPPVW